jgi:uncharacterized repeat protein (TIGR01451 family)
MIELREKIFLLLGLGLALILVLGLNSGPALVHATDNVYYVSETGDDVTGDGSQGNPWATLSYALGQVSAGVTISVTGTITDSATVTESVIIQGAGATNTIVQASPLYYDTSISTRVFTVTNGAVVTMTGMTIRHGRSAQPFPGDLGGGIHVDGGTLTLQEVTVSYNTAANDGGGVYVSSGNVLLTDVQVLNNIAGQWGGGVFVASGSATLSETRVLSNTAGDDGGGVFLWNADAALAVHAGQIAANTADDDGGGVCVRDGSAWLTGTQVFDNDVGDKGAGVYVDNGSVTLIGTQILSNTADNRGGGMFVFHGDVVLLGGRVSANTATTFYGGGVCISLGSAVLTGTQILDNTAGHLGGGVFVAEGNVMLNGTQILNNTAGGHGGGVSVYDESATVSVNAGQIGANTASYSGGGVYVRTGNVWLTDTLVLSNTAGDKGGGMYVASGRVMLIETQVLDNIADDRGGGVYIDDSSVMLLGGQVSANTATTFYGGGVYVSSGSVVLTGTQILDNVAGQWGGGIFVAEGSAVLSATQILSNTASGHGGGACVYDESAIVSMSAGQIGANAASFNGGGVYVSWGRAVFTGTRILANTAGRWGGGMFVAEGSVTLSATRVLSNTAVSRGGGIYLSSPNGVFSMTGGCVVNNSDVGVYNAAGAGTLAGTLIVSDTWWGVPDGPYVGLGGSGTGDSIGAGVDVPGFRINAPPGCPSLRGDLAVVKTAASPAAQPGGEITYILAFSNAGPHVARHVRITDTLPAEVDYLTYTASLPVTHIQTGTNHIWLVTGMGLPVSQEHAITLTGRVTSVLPANHVFTNRVEIATLTDEEGLGNNEDDVEVTCYAHAVYLPLAFKQSTEEKEVVLYADFDAGVDGFVYVDDAFRGTNQPDYASGVWLASGGFDAGGLRVTLGGIDRHEIVGMSGGWQRTFYVSKTVEVVLSFRYNLTQSPNYESEEYSQFLVSLDGVLYGTQPNDYVAQIVGDGDGGDDETTGWQVFETNLGTLTVGEHTLVIGGFNNKKTLADEFTEASIDDVSIVEE